MLPASATTATPIGLLTPNGPGIHGSVTEDT